MSSEGPSNLNWLRQSILPDERFIVPIINDDEPEYTEVLEVWVECVENCYLPQTKYIITIIDDDGMNIFMRYIIIIIYGYVWWLLYIWLQPLKVAYTTLYQ